MKHKTWISILLVLSIAFLVGLLLLPDPAGVDAQEPQEPDDKSSQASLGFDFTYQGRLVDDGQPANGEYDLQFKLSIAYTPLN